MSPKETFIEMVQKWAEAKNYDELRAVKLMYFDESLKKLYFANMEADDKTLGAEDKQRLYNFDHNTMPTLDMAQSAVENIDANETTLEIPEALRQKVYMVLENNIWKYSIKNETGGIEKV